MAAGEFDLFYAVDLIASEYGWSIEYVQNLSMEEISKLSEAIKKRKISELEMLCYIVNCAITGKTPKLHPEKEDSSKLSEEQQLKKLMKELGGVLVSEPKEK